MSDAERLASYRGDPLDVYVAADDLLEVLRRPAWMRDALCIEHPGVSWFPKPGEPVDAAKAVCGRCAVRGECLAYALAEIDLEGVWAGTTLRQRRAIRLGRVA